MSHEIVKGIKITEGKVMIKSDSNNVYPKIFKWWECKPLSDILNKEGLTACEIAIMKDYEEGTFQGTENKYTRALKSLRYIYAEEYNKFNWRNSNDSEEHKEIDELRKTQEFKDLLFKALNTKTSDKFIIKVNYGGIDLFLRKETKKRYFYGTEAQAKQFRFKEEAESKLKSLGRQGEIIKL